MSANIILQCVLDRLQLEAAQPVETAITHFSDIPPPPETQLSLSSLLPTIFTSLDTLDDSYSVLLALPVPNPLQLSEIRDLLQQSPPPGSADTPASLCITHLDRQTYIPIWIVQVWPRLHMLIRHCLSWFKVLSTLCTLSDSSGTVQSLACELLERIPSLTLDSPTPNSIFRHLRTSHLPVLIQNAWLSDDHINAGVELINWHPERVHGVHALNTHFIDYLRRQFDRSPTYPASRLTRLDHHIINSSVHELLIPLHLPSHWVLLYINIGLRCYSYTDTLDLTESSAPPVTIGLVNRWLSSLLGLDITLSPSPRPFSIGAQFDSSSCGVAVISSMAHYALQGPYQAWTQSRAQEHRLAWALRFSSLSDNLDLPVFDTYLEDLDSDSDDETPASPVSNPICVSTTTNSSDAELEDCPKKPTLPHAKLRQTTLPFKSIPYDEYTAQEKRRYADRLTERENERAHFEYLELQKKAKKRECERNRKRAQRARQKMARKAAEEARKSKLDVQQPSSVLPTMPNARQTISSLSRPYSAINTAVARQDSNRPSKRQSPLQPTRRINWCHPAYWNVIESSAHAVGYPWRPVDIVARLRSFDYETFQYLRPQRISQWRDHQYPDELRWTESHLRAVEAGSRPVTGIGRQGVFHDRPDVVEIIKKCLSDLRKTGVGLNLKLIRGYMMGVIKHYMPEAFSRITRSGRRFCCSERFVRQFLREELGWSVRKATRAAQKYPSNVDSVLLDAFLRMACAVRDYAIPDCCIVNADQTQVVYSSGDQKTWTASGGRQVNILGAEDKRAFTLLVAAAVSGDLLPFQAIYTGKTMRAVPDSTCPGWSDAQKLGFLLEPSNTSSYWSTFDTMCNWVTKILAPYFDAQKRRNGLPADQRCILQIDCWSVHRSAQFRAWMKEHYPWIMLMYVPGGCTGLFQACDVGIQRVLKIAIRNAAHADIVAETVNALRSGVEPQYVVNDQSLPTLRRRSLNWILQAYHAINRPDIIKKAFRLCAVPNTTHNLSYESLVSAAARQALVQLSVTNPTLYKELTSFADSLPPAESTEECDVESPVDGTDEDDEINPTIEEVCRMILAAESACDASQPIVKGVDEGDAEGLEDVAPPVPAATAPQSGRVGRRSVRLRNK